MEKSDTAHPYFLQSDADVAQKIAACDALPVRWVSKPGQLDELVDVIDSIDAVALDTEFIRVNTFAPQLALVQINTGEAIYLVDAPRLDLRYFWEALSEIPKMVWFACGEDLVIFYQEARLANCKPLANVVDVQIGLAYLGEEALGYARVLQRIGVVIDKSQVKSDWFARPLSPEQEQYAANDVRYLLMLHDLIEEALKNKNLHAFAQEDSLLYAKEIFEDFYCDDDELYVYYLSPFYNRDQIAALQDLVAWRQRLARQQNCPTGYIMRKKSLREIVERLPTHRSALAATSLHPRSLRIYGRDIVAIVRQALRRAQEDNPSFLAYRVQDASFYGRLDYAVVQGAQRLSVPSAVFFKKRWRQAILHTYFGKGENAVPDAMQGYRLEWFTSEVLPLIEEYKAKVE